VSLSLSMPLLVLNVRCAKVVVRSVSIRECGLLVPVVCVKVCLCLLEIKGMASTLLVCSLLVCSLLVCALLVCTLLVRSLLASTLLVLALLVFPHDGDLSRSPRYRHCIELIDTIDTMRGGDSRANDEKLAQTSAGSPTARTLAPGTIELLSPALPRAPTP